MRVAVFYATREGHTRRIADRIAEALRSRDVGVDVFDVRTLRGGVEWWRYATAFVAASVHVGRHEPEMIAFVKQHRPELERLRAALLSVSLSEAGAEDSAAPNDRRRQSAADVQRMIDVFVEQTAWHPADVMPVAGALAYSHYNPIVRLVMRLIARRAGAPSDASHDYEFTNWDALARFVDERIRNVA